ncbi:MAG: sugar phosphate isomerase/epimerase [Candidatus Pacearchaeota archaeon]
MVYEQPKSYEVFYEGTYSQLEPTYGPLFLGYRVPFSSLQLHTNPQTANIITEASDRLSSGVKGVMVNVLDPRTFENIPKQLFDEVRQLHKLVGAEPSMHAPIIDPAGFGGRGEWSEHSRQEAEMQLKNVIDRAHALDPSGNIPVTVHASMMPSTEWWKKAPEEKALVYAINTETNQIAPLPYEEKFYPGPEGVRKVTFTTEDQLEAVNQTHWRTRIVDINKDFIHAEEVLSRAFPIIAPVWSELKAIEKKILEQGPTPELKEELDSINRNLTQKQYEAFTQINAVVPIYEDVALKLSGAFNEIYKDYSEAIKRETNEKERKKYEEALEKIKEIGNDIYSAEKSREPVVMHQVFSKALHNLNEIARISPPKIYKSIEEFSLPHTSETVANVALHAYKKYGNKAPVIALENIYPNMAFSRADSLRKLIEESRKKFIEKAVNEGYSYDKARQIAENLIGATWDVGHAFMLKKHGYEKEEIIEETGAIAPFVKFVHLTDNFGFEDTHLPPGMGEVPFKELLKELEKAGKLKQVIEAGGLLNLGREAGRVILPATLEALGPPAYSYQPRGPFWNQLPYLQGPYSLGYGSIFPEQHFNIYGGGFSALPQELGGQVPGRGQRFSGAPME